MNNNADTERIIDIKDLFYRIAKQWRKIIVGAIVIALIACIYQVFLGLRLLLDDDQLAKVQEKYEIAINDFEATGERLKTSITNLRDQSARQLEYNNKSELMKIDPMNKWIGSFQVYVDSQYQIDPNLTYQNVDRTNRLVYAYTNYLQSGELYNAILNSIHTVDEIRFLTEIYSISSDPGSATFTVHCIGKSESDVRTLMDYVQKKISEHFETIQAVIGDHNYEVLTESVFTTIDLSLDAQQKSNLLAITDYANEIGKCDQELTEWEKTGRPRPEFGTWYTVKQAIKSLIFGGILGIVILILWYVLCYILKNTVKTVKDWEQFGIPVLGCITRDKQKRRFQSIDNLIDRIFGRNGKTSFQQNCMLAAHTLSEMMKCQNISAVKFVGDVRHDIADCITEILKSTVPGYDFSFAGDALADPDTANNLNQAKQVILLADNMKTSFNSIDQTLTYLRAWGKTVLGVIVLE